MLRVRLLNELVRTLGRDARHAKDAGELMHVERSASHLLDAKRAGLDLAAHREHALEEERGGGERVDLEAPRGEDAKPVDVDGHRRPRTQVGELLPPLLHPVALGRRLLLEIGLERLALAALALKVGDDRGRVVVLVVRQQRPHGGEVALARCERRIKGDTA